VELEKFNENINNRKILAKKDLFEIENN